MTVDTSQNIQLGVWESPPFQITLYDTKNTLTAEATHTEGKKAHFSSKSITCGIMGKLPHAALIDKIDHLAKEKIAVFPYPKERPTELWVFEAEKMASLEIRQGKEHLKKTDDTLEFHQKTLENFQTALKLQEKFKGDTAELQEAVAYIKKGITLLKCNQNSSLYLPSDKAIEAFKEVITTYQEEKDIFECFKALLSVTEEKEFASHHHFMSALVHEETGVFLFAVKDYLSLAEGNPRGSGMH